MMCKNCGAYMLDDATVCPGCGAVIQHTYAPSILAQIAKILMILTTVCCGFVLIPLAWCIPMTVHYCKCLKNGSPISIGFKVCVILFMSPIAGILMLCDNQ